MRFFSLVICTLSVFLTVGLTAQASEKRSSFGTVQELVTPNSSATTPTISSRVNEAATLIKIPEEQKFVHTASIESGRESYSKASLSQQKTQAVSEAKVGTLAEAFPQNSSSQQKTQAIPEAKVGTLAEAFPQNSSSQQKAQAVPEVNGGTLAGVAPQTHVAEIPVSETIHSDKSVTELSTLNPKQPASEASLKNNSSLSSLPSPQNTGEIKRNMDLRQTQQENPVLSKAEALRPNEPIAQSWSNNASQLRADAQPQAAANCVAQNTTPESGSGSTTNQLAQGTTGRCPRPQPVTPLVLPKVDNEFESSPALSIYIPVGYGADRNTLFVTGSYQNSVRRDDGSVGAGGIGVGLGDADKLVGLELSYTMETPDQEFGDGGFNAKIHRRLGEDASIAAGWNGFLNLGRNDFEQSKYGVITKVFRTQESLDTPFSRVAVTVGVGDGQFRSNGAVHAGDNNVNVFGNVAIRVVRPVSFIAEWTGQDLGLGLSIAPFRHFPFVITPAVRDLAGAGDGPRFVLGAGTAIQF